MLWKHLELEKEERYGLMVILHLQRSPKILVNFQSATLNIKSLPCSQRMWRMQCLIIATDNLLKAMTENTSPV